MSNQLALAVEGKRAGLLVVVLAVLLAALAAVGSPLWGNSPLAHAQTPPQPNLCGGLYQVNPDGSLNIGTIPQVASPTSDACTPAGKQDVPNNVITYTHEVCFVSTPDVIAPVPATPTNTTFGPGQNSFTYYFNVVGLGAGNTPAPIQGTVLQNPSDADSFSLPTTINGYNEFADGPIVCATWTSVNPGDQQITLNANFNNNPIAGMATGNPDTTVCPGAFNNTPAQTACDPLLKEWNLLSPTTITSTVATSPQSTAPAAGLENSSTPQQAQFTLNPATSIYQGQSATYYENVWGTHTPNQASQQWYLVIGAKVTFTNTGNCADLIVDPNGDTTLPGGPHTVSVGNSVTVTSIGQSIPFYFVSDPSDTNDGCTSQLNSQSQVTIQAGYPGAPGSNVPTIPSETLTVNWKTTPPPAKQVLLAWAGQTVILEHDWRIPPGDSSTLDPAGECAFTAQPGDNNTVFIKYVRQDGPGSFVGGLDAVTLFSDGGYATVAMSTNNSQVDTAPGDPQGSCISRVLYESDDQGEVDIIAYQTLTSSGDQTMGQSIGTGTVNQTTYPFVIYYMKLNQVQLTNVAASKPTHNSSIAPDWSPSNPWDASSETASTTSNVSKDVLVRGRVTGWFLNSDPSGRAADTSDPNNVLPANRWVMPDDWVQLAGGTAVANSFRPSYDLMFAPSNTGLALTTPMGTGLTQVGVTLTGSGTGTLANNSPTAPTPASPILVPNASNIHVGDSIIVGTQGAVQVIVIAPVSGVGFAIFTATPIVAPAAGTPIFEAGSGVPFEGPYSLIDIQGLAISNGGIAGAALSNIAGVSNSATRDTTLGDGNVDMWDAPMPPANISVSIRGTGFIKQVIKSDVYYLGTPNTSSQTFPNPYYIENIPGSPYIPANVAGGNLLWDSWGPDGPAADSGAASSNPPGLKGDGPYTFWEAVPALIGQNEVGVYDPLVDPSNPLNATRIAELNAIRTAYGDATIARDLVVFSDNHGEFMVAANGDFLTNLSACATNSLGGGKQCKPGDAVGTGTVTAVADYPFLKKHAPVASNADTINWTWGGYKSVTVEKDPAGNSQYVYLVFHAIDRDGHCSNGDGAVLLHPVLTALDAASPVGSNTALGYQTETVDYKIDSGQGIIVAVNGPTGIPNTTTGTNVTGTFATGIPTYSLAAAKLTTGAVYFPMDASLAASGQTDECQSWIKVSNSLLSQTNVLTIAHDDEGNIGFDRVLDFQQTQSYTLNFRWTLFTWAGKDGISVMDAIKGGSGVTDNPLGNDISDQVTAIYGWQPDSQTWLGWFPTGVNVPGANDLTSLHTGQAYWIAIKGPGNVTWTITTNVS